MSEEIPTTQARDELTRIIQQVHDTNDVVYVTNRGRRELAIIDARAAASEVSLETAKKAFARISSQVLGTDRIVFLTRYRQRMAALVDARTVDAEG